jgi:peptide/nickel transport system substrate-binding protein
MSRCSSSLAEIRKWNNVVYIPVPVIENKAAIRNDVKAFSISPAGYLEINDITIQ